MLRQILSLSLVLFTAASAVGCGSDEEPVKSEGARVFDVPPAPSANGGELLGVWETVAPQKNPPLSVMTRFELRVDSIAVALKCSLDDGSAQPITVGGKSEATVSKDGITVKKAIERVEPIGSTAACGVQFSAGQLPPCQADTAPEKRQTCFVFEPGSLKVYAGTSLELKKIAD